MMNRKILVLAGFFLIAGFQNCAKTEFANSASSTATQAATQSDGNCTLRGITKPVRVMFMVDDSRSTILTDADKKYRYRVIQQFINSYRDKLNFTYSYSYFSDVPWTYQMSAPNSFVVANSGSPAKNPFGGSVGIQGALNVYKSLRSSGSTCYRSAFQELTRLIETQKGSSADLHLVFMSDGQPTDLGDGEIQNDGVKKLVQQLRLSAGQQKIFVSAIFFGDFKDDLAISNLKIMAQEGEGKFLDVNQNTDFRIEDLLPVPQMSCQQ